MKFKSKTKQQQHQQTDLIWVASSQFLSMENQETRDRAAAIGTDNVIPWPKLTLTEI